MQSVYTLPLGRRSVYTPQDGIPMKVAFAFSGGATGLKTTVEDNPDHGELYEVVFCFTNKRDCNGVGLAQEYELPLAIRGRKPYKDRYPDPEERRIAYSTDFDEIMREVNPDVIVTSGFMVLLTDPFVTNWYGKAMNGHPAKTYILKHPQDLGQNRIFVGDLSTHEAESRYPLIGVHHGGKHKRKFTGDNAVYDAVLAGEDEVKTAVFFIDHGEDTGPNIVHSQPLRVDREHVDPLIRENNLEAVQGYSSELQQALKFDGDGPAIREALRLAAQGRLELEERTVFLDGEPLPYKGFQL
jgi:folate-dependent phosphoribosylglycinamide formyltransferase PurN